MCSWSIGVVDVHIDCKLFRLSKGTGDKFGVYSLLLGRARSQETTLGIERFFSMLTELG